VLLRIGVLVEEPSPACPARTAVVNRHGALVLSPRSYDLGARLRLRNLESGERVDARVVWAGGTDESGSHKLGIEFTEERPNFWGQEYEAAILADGADAG
jgi:hypothetical protein